MLSSDISGLLGWEDQSTEHPLPLHSPWLGLNYTWDETLSRICFFTVSGFTHRWTQLYSVHALFPFITCFCLRPDWHKSRIWDRSGSATMQLGRSIKKIQWSILVSAEAECGRTEHSGMQIYFVLTGDSQNSSIFISDLSVSPVCSPLHSKLFLSESWTVISVQFPGSGLAF